MDLNEKWFTIEDAKASFNLFCCVYGIGTLGMPGNYARAGPMYGTIALIFMACTNIYSSVLCGKLMLIAPKNVKTYTDLGEWSMGTFGRYIVVFSQMGNCLLLPCAFLVLGSTLLTTLFPDALSPYFWIVLMAFTTLPVTLTPTLKESAAIAMVGCLGTIFADFIALGVLVYYLHNSHGISPPAPNHSIEQIVSVFGNLSLAYGAGIVIPAIQRQHSEPQRMPRVIFFTLTFASILFIIISITGYSIVGCQIPGNLLFAISSTKMGFTSDRGAVVLSYLAMQLHISIAFAVILHPALYLAERQFLGMHPSQEIYESNGKSNTGIIMATGDDIQNITRYPFVSITSTKNKSSSRINQKSATSFADIEHRYDDKNIQETLEPNERIKSIVFRTFIVILLVIVSSILKDHFLALADFIGASCVNISCIILPILFYLKQNWNSVPIYEKSFGVFVITMCSFLAVYLTIKFGKELFSPVDEDVNFPYCPIEYQEYYFTNSTFYSNK